jgi:hypothetical protein
MTLSMQIYAQAISLMPPMNNPTRLAAAILFVYLVSLALIIMIAGALK